MGGEEEGECFPRFRGVTIMCLHRQFRRGSITTVVPGRKKQLVKYGWRWNTRMVVAHQQKEKIDSLLKRAGHAPGSNGYIKFYQQAVGR